MRRVLVLRPILAAGIALATAAVMGLPTPADRTTAFVHANVVPMDGERVLHDQTVVVSGGRIAAVGPTGKTPVPKGALVIDVKGRYLSPGLADMHVHVYAPQELTLYAVNGVTTIFNLNGRPAHLSWRKRIAAGELLGPTIYSAGPTFDRPRAREEAVEEVDRQSAAGYDAVKIYNQVGAAEYPGLAAEARKKGLVLVGHVARAPGFAATLSAGQSIAHAEEYVYTFFNDDPDPKNETVHPLDTMKIPQAVAMTREAGVSVIPTLVAFHNIVRQATAVDGYLKDPHLAYMAPFMRQQLEPDRNTYATRFPKERLPGLAVSYEFQRQLVRALHEGGVPILAGTDASWLGVPGFSLVEEIENFQELGFTPYAALKTATVDPARLLRQEHEFGTIAVGKRADLILTRKSPLEDVRNLREVDGVMADGRWIPDSERRRLLESLPAAYREGLARLAKKAESNPADLGADLGSNDPFGAVSAAVWSELASTRGPKKLVEALSRLRKVDPESPLLSEEAINELGYSLAGSKQTEAAIEVFRLNTELYPKSGNTFDSLAETHLRAGNAELARQNYAKALEVQPDYPNAKAAREILAKELP
jgi:cytosine/adenosine deaminase-related metal-dependent hydrolase